MEPALQGLLSHLMDSSQHAKLVTTVAPADTLVEFRGGPLTGSLMVGWRDGCASEGL